MLGILLANTGSPTAPTPQAVRAYLARFLSDRRVVDLPRWLWLPVLHGVILNVRPRRSTRLYRRIWTEAGSPLVVVTQRLAARLQTRLEAEVPGGCRVVAGMRYSHPGIDAGLRALRAAGCERLAVLPLFPQYSTTTTASMFDAAAAELRTWETQPAVRWVEDYHDHPAYIQALVGSLRRAWAGDGPPDCLLFSFHGIPRSYAERGDPYEAQCRATAAMVAEALELPAGAWQTAFQSRFGPQAWLTPSTEETLLELARRKTRRVDVIAPGFAVDCLETLDEIANEGRRRFVEAGGGEFRYVPALNDGEEQVNVLTTVLLKSISDN